MYKKNENPRSDKRDTGVPFFIIKNPHHHQDGAEDVGDEKLEFWSNTFSPGDYRHGLICKCTGIRNADKE